MEKIAYIDIEDYVKEIYEIDSDIFDIMLRIDSFVKSYKGLQYNEKLYKFDIERITDLLYDIICEYKQSYQEMIITIPMDTRYFLVLSDTIKYLNNIK